MGPPAQLCPSAAAARQAEACLSAAAAALEATHAAKDCRPSPGSSESETEGGEIALLISPPVSLITLDTGKAAAQHCSIPWSSFALQFFLYLPPSVKCAPYAVLLLLAGKVWKVTHRNLMSV